MLSFICLSGEKNKVISGFGEGVLPTLPAASQGSSTGKAKDAKPQLIPGRLRGSFFCC